MALKLRDIFLSNGQIFKCEAHLNASFFNSQQVHNKQHYFADVLV